jgi:hypothetical protein
MAWALHVSALEELSTAVAALIDMRIPKGIPATVAAEPRCSMHCRL